MKFNFLLILIVLLSVILSENVVALEKGKVAICNAKTYPYALKIHAIKVVKEKKGCDDCNNKCKENKTSKGKRTNRFVMPSKREKSFLCQCRKKSSSSAKKIKKSLKLARKLASDVKQYCKEKQEFSKIMKKTEEDSDKAQRIKFKFSMENATHSDFDIKFVIIKDFHEEADIIRGVLDTARDALVCHGLGKIVNKFNGADLSGISGLSLGQLCGMATKAGFKYANKVIGADPEKKARICREIIFGKGEDKGIGCLNEGVKKFLEYDKGIIEGSNQSLALSRKFRNESIRQGKKSLAEMRKKFPSRKNISKFISKYELCFQLSKRK